VNLVLWSLGIMTALGVLFGVCLAIAGRFFRVETDERIETVARALPGINCGACGYAGCDAYAEAVVQGAPPNLCIPGGRETAENVAHIMGRQLDVESREVRAVIHCQGGTDRCGARYDYEGIPSCAAADLLQNGPKKCDYGCLGFGDCADACPFGAISMRADRIPVVDWDKCTGCGTCVGACPRNLIETLPTTVRHVLACSSQGKGKAVKQACSVGCIACWLCVKVSPEGSIEKDGNLPRLIYTDGADYAPAMEKCPMNCFVQVEPPCVVARAELLASGHKAAAR